MKKIVKVGYVGRTQQPKIMRDNWLGLYLTDVHETKGLKEQWGIQDWPPIKVRITVEEVKLNPTY